MSSIRYCIFEDEYYTCRQLAETISALRPNYQLVGTADDCQGIRQCLDLAPDLIVADINISDGLSSSTLLSMHCQIPIIAITGYYQDINQLEGLCQIACLLKPTSPQQLESAFTAFESRLHSANCK